MMRKLVLGAMALASSMLLATGAGATVIFSDNFNDGDASDWTVSTNFSPFPNVGSSTTVTAPGNTYRAELQIDQFNNLGQPHGTVFNIFVRGSHGFSASQAGAYTLSFLAGSSACQGCTPRYEVFLDNALVTNGVFVNALEARNVLIPNLSAGSHTLTLGMFTDAANNGNFFARFDDVVLDSVQPIQGGVPEPATWAMMLAGFLGLGSMVRRRRAALA